MALNNHDNNGLIPPNIGELGQLKKYFFKNWLGLMARVLVIIVVSAILGSSFNHFRAAGLSWQWSPPPASAPIVKNIENLQKALGRPETIIVDARDPLFYQFGHIPGAVSLPLETTDEKALQAWIKNINPKSHIIIYCSDSLCPMADQLAQKIMALGLRPSVFKPGFDEWELSGLEVEK